MRQYRLPAIMYQPCKETENKYMAEIPVLEGCRAWGDTPSEAQQNLRDVAAAFIRSFKELKQVLPPAVEEKASELGESGDVSEVTIYY